MSGTWLALAGLVALALWKLPGCLLRLVVLVAAAGLLVEVPFR